MLSSLRLSAGSAIRQYTVQQSRIATSRLAASFSTTSRQCSGWLSASITPYQSSNATTDLSPDYEIRRRFSGDLPPSSVSMSASANSTKDATNDWMDVLDDAAEAQEAIRAFKEDGLVLGISNRDGLINLME